MIDQFVNSTGNFLLRSVVKIESALYSESVASHNCSLCTSAFTYDKRGVRVGSLHTLVVVNNVVSELIG